MVFNDLLAQGQAEAGTLVFLGRMEALEDQEDPLDLVGRDADPIVLHTELPGLGLLVRRLTGAMRAGGHVDARRFFVAELDGIPQQVLKELDQ